MFYFLLILIHKAHEFSVTKHLHLNSCGLTGSHKEQEEKWEHWQVDQEIKLRTGNIRSGFEEGTEAQQKKDKAWRIGGDWPSEPLIAKWSSKRQLDTKTLLSEKNRVLERVWLFKIIKWKQDRPCSLTSPILVYSLRFPVQIF